MVYVRSKGCTKIRSEARRGEEGVEKKWGKEGTRGGVGKSVWQWARGEVRGRVGSRGKYGVEWGAEGSKK